MRIFSKSEEKENSGKKSQDYWFLKNDYFPQ